MIRSVLAAAALLLATATPASAEPTDYLIWDSDQDAHPTQGRSGSWTPPDSFAVRESDEIANLIEIKGGSQNGWEYLGIQLSRHDGQRIAEGHYAHEKVLVINRGLGWTDDDGNFAVEHIAYDADGHISEFEGAVEQHYQGKPNTTFRAKISYRR
jgi:hypothetical protein